jgi:hypothetical protein
MILSIKSLLFRELENLQNAIAEATIMEPPAYNRDSFEYVILKPFFGRRCCSTAYKKDTMYTKQMRLGGIYYEVLGFALNSKHRYNLVGRYNYFYNHDNKNCDDCTNSGSDGDCELCYNNNSNKL